jgi:hypothetical protein
MSEPTSKASASWLRLELHALGELSAAEAAEVAADLERDADSRRCLERIHGDRRDLPRLPVPEPQSSPWARLRRHLYLAWAPLAVAAAVVVLLVVRGGQPEQVAGVPGPRIQVKGGDVAIALVRERDGVIAHEPADFAAGDRFKVLLTCPPDRRLHGEVLVIQDGETGFPLAPVDLACGNRVALPGAFRLTGAAPAAVCFTFADTPLDRTAPKAKKLARKLARKPAVCATLDPAP